MTTKRRTVQVAAVLGIGVCVLTLPAHGQDCPELVGGWPAGPPRAVAVSGNYAYFGSGAGMVVANVSDPLAPEIVGSIGLPALAIDIAVSGDYAYVIDFHVNLHMIDISEPSSPHEVGLYDTPGDWNPHIYSAYGVAVSGEYAVVAAGAAGIRVVDVSEPSAPVEVGVYPAEHGERFEQVVVQRNFAYTAGQLWSFGRLSVIDISLPSEPILEGLLDFEEWGRVRDVAVRGDYAYLPHQNAGLSVVDVSDPSSPTEAGVFPCDRDCHFLSVEVSDHFVFAAGVGLSVIDVSDPTAPILIGKSTGGTMWDLSLSGSYAFGADHEGGAIEIFDVAVPEQPVLVASILTPGAVRAVAATDHHAYVVDRIALRILDLSEPTAPFEVGFYELDGEPADIAVAGQYVIVSGYDFQVIDVSNPTSPRIIGALPGGFGRMATTGDHAYVQHGGVSVIDLSNPTLPSIVGSLDIEISDIAAAGDYAFVVNGDGLHVIDVSEPTAPTEVGLFGAPDWYPLPCGSVSVSGGYAYVRGGYYIHVIDVSDPTAPTPTGSVPYARGCFVASALHSARGLVLVAYDREGLFVIDPHDPTNPIEVGFWPSEWATWWGIATRGSLAYVSHGDLGLAVVDFGSCPGFIPTPRRAGRRLVPKSAPGGTF